MKNPIVWFEIGGRDTGKMQSFYSSLFEWRFDIQGGMPMLGDVSEGIGGHLSSLGHEPHNYVTVYVQVDDIDGYLRKAEGLGAKTIVPKTEVPSMGHFAWFTDPDGNAIGLWTPSARP